MWPSMLADATAELRRTRRARPVCEQILRSGFGLRASNRQRSRLSRVATHSKGTCISTRCCTITAHGCIQLRGACRTPRCLVVPPTDLLDTRRAQMVAYCRSHRLRTASPRSPVCTSAEQAGQTGQRRAHKVCVDPSPIGTVVYIRMCVSGTRGSPDSLGHLRSRELTRLATTGGDPKTVWSWIALYHCLGCMWSTSKVRARALSAKVSDLYGVEAILQHRSQRGTVHRVPGQVARIRYRRRYLGPGSAGCGHQSNHLLRRCTGDAGSGSRACHALSDSSSSPRVFGGGHVREPCFPTSSGGHGTPATGHSSLLYLSPSLLSHGFPHWGF